MRNDMKYEVNHHFIIVRFIGDVDSSNVGLYRQRLNDLIEQYDKDVVFEFSETMFIDSSGIGLILGRYNQLKREHRTLMICGLNAVAYRLFELTGLFQIIPYFSDLQSIKEGSL